MTETEKLRALLDARGVGNELEHNLYVEWVDARGNEVTAFETSCKHKGRVLVVHAFLTPAQAVEATLGRGECEMRSADGSFCSVNRPVYLCECGAFCTDYTDASAYHKPRYCPNCGRRVKEAR